MRVVVLEKGFEGRKLLEMLNISNWDEMKVGEIYRLVEEPSIFPYLEKLLFELSKEGFNKLENLKNVYFEDTRRRHGFWVILDKGDEEDIESTSFFIRDSVSEVSKKILRELIPKLTWYKINEAFEPIKDINVVELTPKGVEVEKNRRY